MEPTTDPNALPIAPFDAGVDDPSGLDAGLAVAILAGPMPADSFSPPVSAQDPALLGWNPATPPFPPVPPLPKQPSPSRQFSPLSRRAWLVMLAGVLGSWMGSATAYVGIGGLLYAGMTAAGLMASGLLLPGRSTPRRLAGTAALIGCFLTVRDSPWLAWLNTVSIIVLLASAAALAQNGALFDSSRTWFRDRIGATLFATVRSIGVPFELLATLTRQSPTKTSRFTRLPPIKGLVLALPLLLVIIPLLMSSDAIFSEFFSLPTRLIGLIPVPSFVDVVAAGWGGYTAAVLLVAASAGAISARTTQQSVAAHSIRTRTFAVGDVRTALWLVNGVLGAFAVSQVIAATTLGKRITSDDLSYEAIAKRGFFPLLVASLFILGSFIVAYSLVTEDERHQRGFRVPAQLLAVLSVLLVVTASRRLYMGAEVWGLTMLRVLSQTFAIWLALVFVSIGVWQQRRSTRAWVPGAALVIAVGLLVTLNLLPTEQIVVRWNTTSGQITGFTEGEGSDTFGDFSRDGGLSACRYYDDSWHGRNDDALPELVGWLRVEVKMKRASVECARELLACDDRPNTNGLSWNYARWHANDVRSDVCGEFVLSPEAPPSAP